MTEEIEIPFGAFDSETIGWTYTIPEGFTAKIEDGKIIVEKRAESKDEMIWKPSEEEINAFETALKGEFKNGVYPEATLCKLFGELKTLYYNDAIPKWKPSEEQINALAKAIITLGGQGDNKTVMYINEIRTELKKL